MQNDTNVVRNSTALSFSTFIFGWLTLALLCAFLANSVLINWLNWPGVAALLSADAFSILSLLQIFLYLIAIGVSVLVARAANAGLLRHHATQISNVNAFLVRAAFWAVLLVGVVDASISFLRVEGILNAFVGEQLTKSLAKSSFRGPYIHTPLILIGIVLAAFTRTLGFVWLTILVVVAELVIVMSRFVFSYEQPLMADLVRFWYGALFLFASAYTLLEDRHVRVDLFYAGMSSQSKGISNAIGAILFGMSFCWVIILIGIGGPSSVINGPILVYEITQAGFGLFVKYLMAGFLGVFAITMLIQFVAMLFEAVADILNQPKNRTNLQAKA